MKEVNIMANNWMGWSSTANVEKALNTNDLVVGDRLVKVNMRHGWSEQVYEVTKILKTRLVIRPLEPRQGQTELRILVENSKYSTWNHGRVSSRIEGSDTGYFAAEANLFTLDSAKLEELRAQHIAEDARKEARINANAALAAFKQSLTVEHAEEAISALQAWVANQKETK